MITMLDQKGKINGQVNQILKKVENLFLIRIYLIIIDKFKDWFD